MNADGSTEVRDEEFGQGRHHAPGRAALPPGRGLQGAGTIYGEETIHERHRHRYEVNNNYLDQLRGAGMRIAGWSGDHSLVEMIEMPDHPWFIACQFHPEFTSRPRGGHPLFTSYIEAANRPLRGDAGVS